MGRRATARTVMKSVGDRAVWKHLLENRTMDARLWIYPWMYPWNVSLVGRWRHMEKRQNAGSSNEAAMRFKCPRATRSLFTASSIRTAAGRIAIFGAINSKIIGARRHGGMPDTSFLSHAERVLLKEVTRARKHGTGYCGLKYCQ